MIGTVPLQSGEITELATAIDNTWVLTVTFLIFFMHAGFAMLESGQVRSKNVANQLTKNLLTWSVGVVVFFLIGVGAANLFAGNGFAAGAPFLNLESAGSYIGWLYGAVFAMTAATIVSGAVAGRAKLRAYVAYTFLLAAVIYPMVIAMTWTGQGTEAGGLVERLTGVVFADFAGGMIVHGLGGIAGLTAAWVLGPRMDKYNADGSVNVIPGHSMTFAVLGTLLLAFGWYGFNVGTAAGINFDPITANSAVLGRAAMATTLAMAMGAVGAAAVSRLKGKKVDTLYVANGLLAGLVGITAIPDVATWWGAIVVGLLAGAQLPIVFEFVEQRLKIDDVCAVFPVHGSAGVLGALAYPFVAVDLGGASIANAFLAQAVGVAVITAWTVTATALIWGAFKAVGQARVDPAHERDGLDLSEHGVETYPEFGQPEVEVATDGGLDVIRADGGTNDPSEIEMVVAFIRPDRLSEVKHELLDTGVQSITVSNVSGRGSQKEKQGQWRGESYTIDLHQKVKIECVVNDIPTNEAVSAIAEGAHTGEPGDGKIFILPVTDAYQIRTGKQGPEAV